MKISKNLFPFFVMIIALVFTTIGSAPTMAGRERIITPEEQSRQQQSQYDTVKKVQRGLTDAGYDPGPVDGILGPKTRSALQSYQQNNDLNPDGRLTLDILERLGALPWDD